MSAELAEHPELLATSQALTEYLGLSRSRLVSGEVFNAQHGEFAARAASLQSYLQGALALSASHLYPQAFALLRASMEHHVVDGLLFLGNRYKAIIEDVPDETLAEWQETLADGQGAPDVLAIRRHGKRNVEVTRTGVHFEGEAKGPGGPALSIYYSVLDSFDPFTGGRAAQTYIGDWPFRQNARAQRVARQAESWKKSLTWAALMANFALNDFYTPVEIARWHVHYSFLSAFVHPVSGRATSAVYGRNDPKSIRYDHYASELSLLYVVTLAYLELEAFDAMARREPVVDLRDRAGVLTAVERGKKLAAHLWFPSGAPHMFDRVQEANWRGVSPAGGLVPWDDRAKPDDLADDEVRYYENPLKRLIEMHAGIPELTGFQWASPWQRTDAWQRRLDC